MTPIEWTPPMREWFVAFVPGHSEKEVAEAFEARWGIPITRSKVKNAKTRFGVRSGTVGGRFEPGHVPANKGVPLSERGLTDEQMGRIAARQFRRGHRPANAKPIGSERVSADGYVEVKVADGRRNRNYRAKHVVVYEELHGPVPDGCHVVFADGDRRNFDPGNLVAVPRRLMAQMNSMRIEWRDADTLRSAMAVAEVRIAAARAERSMERTCRECGARFSPGFRNQSRCRACIDSRKGAPR